MRIQTQFNNQRKIVKNRVYRNLSVYPIIKSKTLTYSNIIMKMNIPQMTKIIKIDIISIVSPVSGAESDNGTSSSKSVVVFLLVVEAFGVSESVNSLLANGVSSSISTKEGVDEADGVGVTITSCVVDAVAVGV